MTKPRKSLLLALALVVAMSSSLYVYAHCLVQCDSPIIIDKNGSDEVELQFESGTDYMVSKDVTNNTLDLTAGGVEGISLGSDRIWLKHSIYGEFSLSGTTAQFLGDGQTIDSSSPYRRIQPLMAGAVDTSTSTPIEAPVRLGQLIIIQNVGAFTITIKNNGSTIDTELEGGVDLDLEPRDVVMLIAASTGKWTQIAPKSDN